MHLWRDMSHVCNVPRPVSHAAAGQLKRHYMRFVLAFESAQTGTEMAMPVLRPASDTEDSRGDGVFSFQLKHITLYNE
jgi:hypothetical protein